MLYRELADIANHFTRDDLDVDGILQAFCLRRFANMRFLASFLFEIEQDGTLHIRGFFGADPKEIGLPGKSLSIFDDHPAAESIRSDSMVCLDSFTVSQSQVKSTLLAWPVQDNARTLGSLVVITDSECDKSIETKEFLDALAILLNASITKHLGSRKSINGSSNGHKPNQSALFRRSNGSGPESLTERQLVILKLLAEGRTNIDIADALGYSESLIRQETIRIYAHLGCNGRSEASNIYRLRYQDQTDEQLNANKVRLDILTDH